jgi:hypothetical protein
MMPLSGKRGIALIESFAAGRLVENFQKGHEDVFRPTEL